MTMYPDPSTILLKRDVPAISIPMGQSFILPAETEVRITQLLGGCFTVAYYGGLARIEGKEAEALGQEPPAMPVPSSTAIPTPGGAASAPVMEQKVWEQLRSCYDPEIPVNIVDLGLIYDCRLTQLGAASHKAEVKMTLTAPGCGMGEVLRQDVVNRLLCLEGVDDVDVQLVWDPPWNQAMMTEAARLQLGLM